MELNLEAQKQEFLTICRASIQREGIEDLLDWLCKADFFTAPASTKYHGGYIRCIDRRNLTKNLVQCKSLWDCGFLV